MRNVKYIASAIVSAIVLSGCVSPKSFVDPSLPKVAYEEIHRRQEPLKLALEVEFQRNGEHLLKVDPTLRDSTERVLRGTGLISPLYDGGEGSIKVVVNNIADKSAAVAKGIGTGLTFGLVGTTVMDAYELSVTITINGKTVTRTGVKHALYTAIGNTSTPPNVEVFSPSVGFTRVLEQMLLRSLVDMQKAGELANVKLPGNEALRVASIH